MPAKNIRKIYIENGFYHIYNRGVEKRPIFLDKQDYKVFLTYLDWYLLPKDDSIKKIKSQDLSEEEKNKKIFKLLSLKNFYKKIEILSFILKPNHFHFQIRQLEKRVIINFFQSIIGKYVQYFNRKYQRVGPLFQGRYKGILINNEEYLLHLSRYIHLNAEEELRKGQKLISYPWSSYIYYIYGYPPKWLNTKYILSYFEKNQGFSFSSYQGFVEGYKPQTQEEKKIYESFEI